MHTQKKMSYLHQKIGESFEIFPNIKKDYSKPDQQIIVLDSFHMNKVNRRKHLYKYSQYT